MQLYKIADQYQKLLTDLYDPETGEINEQVMRELDLIKDEGNQKVISIASFIKNNDAEKQAIEKAKLEMSKREAVLEEKVSWANNYLKDNMQRCGITEIKCPWFVIKLRKNRCSVDDYDPELIPDCYKNTTIMVKTDKNKIYEKLKAGIEIPGARLKQSTSVIIK